MKKQASITINTNLGPFYIYGKPNGKHTMLELAKHYTKSLSRTYGFSGDCSVACANGESFTINVENA